MSLDSRSHQAARIVRGLVGLPGSNAVNVQTRTFPRLGPAERGTGYHQEEQSFGPGEVPEDLPIPPTVDEIIITLKGALDSRQTTEKLLDDVNHLLPPEMQIWWNLRTKIRGRADNAQAYQVTIFSEAYSRSDSFA